MSICLFKYSYTDYLSLVPDDLGLCKTLNSIAFKTLLNSEAASGGGNNLAYSTANSDQ